MNIVPSENNGRFVVYASAYARLDSSVTKGGGTDDTDIIQAILDKAPEWGGLHLVMDGAALVRGLHIHSNTTIECENKDCGFFLAAGSNRSVIENANLDYETIHDRNITLIGGTYNHNCPEQEHHVKLTPELKGGMEEDKWVIAVEFYGVEYLTMRDVTIRNQRTFAMLLANWYRVTMENITIELPDVMPHSNQDGIHFWGPGKHLVMRNIMGTSADDFIALAPDERDGVSDMTDILIDGVILNDADQGIRMLSRGTGKLDRVVIKNVVGTFSSFGFYINPWVRPEGGNFGNITLENIDLRPIEPRYTYTHPFLFRIGGNIESLTLRNICHHLPEWPVHLMELGQLQGHLYEDPFGMFNIRSLVIDGLQIMEDGDFESDNEYIKVWGPIDRMIVRNAQIKKSGGRRGKGALITTTKHTDVGTLHVSGLTLDGMDTLIDHQAGKIGTLCMSDVLCKDAGGPLVSGGGEIGEIFSDGIHGAEIE